MQTFLDDPDIVRLIRSMPFRSRSRFIVGAIGERKFYVVLYAFMLPYLVISMSFALMGPIAWIVASALLAPLFVFPLMMYRNRLLKRHLEEVIVDGQLPNCPSCGESQVGNKLIFCECGCVVRPFAPHG